MIRSVLYILCLFFTLCAEPTGWQDDYHVAAPVNRFDKGGALDAWLALGPLPNPLHIPLSPRSPNRKGFVEDFLVALGGEQGAQIDESTRVVYTDTAGTSHVIRPAPAYSRPDGKVDFSALYVRDSAVAAYAFSYIACNRPRQARLFFCSRRNAKLWVNHRELKLSWNEKRVCRFWEEWFDVDLAEGLNSVLVKVENDSGAWEFAAEVYDRGEMRTAIHKRIDTLMITTDRDIVGPGPDSLTVRVRTNVLMATGQFGGSLALLSARNDTLMQGRYVLGEPLVLEVPQRWTGFLSLQASLDSVPGGTLVARRTILHGDLDSVVMSLRLRLRAIERARDAVGAQSDGLRGAQFPARHIQAWVKRWIAGLDSLPIDVTLRQIPTVQSACDILDSAQSRGIDCGRRPVPILFEYDSLGCDPPDPIYDPSRWFGYKYPHLFTPPTAGRQGEACQAWLYIPAGLRKQPLMLVLHGEGERGRDLDLLRPYIPGFGADRGEPLPAMVLVPQCRAGTWWRPALVRAIVEELVAAGVVDERRIYLLGAGMGGSAVWRQIGGASSFYAAAIVMGAAADTLAACTMKSFPLRIYHGGRDTVVPVEQPSAMAAALRRCGSKTAWLSVYPESDHALWTEVLRNREILQWLFRQRR
jgi:hypothetical protein